MPIVVAEAMMYSKIIICSENAGSAEYIKKYNSELLYQNNDSSELCEKITYVVNNLSKLDYFVFNHILNKSIIFLKNISTLFFLFILI